MTLFNTNKQSVRTIDLLYGKLGCSQQEICQKYRSQFKKRMVNRYVTESTPFRGQFQSAVIDLTGFNYENYITLVKKVHKGAALRQSKKADHAGYYCKRFVWKNFIPDIVEINNSEEVRSGGKMSAAYRRSVEEMGGVPEKLASLRKSLCTVHCTHCWGIFKACPGYRQGDVITDEKLLAYIKFKRQGSLAIYTSILGHGDYLRYGIMYRLHYAIMEWIGQNLTGTLEGLKYLMYGAINSGETGLQQWKKRALFEGTYLVLAEDSIPDSQP